MKRRLRLALPPLRLLEPGSVLEGFWLDARGQALPCSVALPALAATLRGAPLELRLHPEDSLLAQVALPPLPAPRLAAAAACALDGLALEGRDALHLAHGPREADGQVQLAWLARPALARLQRLLAGVRFRLVPAPFFLPLPPPGQVSAQCLDGHLVARSGPDYGWVHPLPALALAEQPDPTRWHWLGPGGPEGVAALPVEAAWQGPAGTLDLAAGAAPRHAGTARWGRALGCCALAALVWTLGLNLYAAQLAEQGQALRRQMNERVRQAFPQLPVVLNPLQQARQQRDARLAGQAPGADGFDSLLRQAGLALALPAGSLEGLDYANGALHLIRPARSASPLPADWQATLAPAGLEGEAVADGWTLRRAPAPEARRDEP